MIGFSGKPRLVCIVNRPVISRHNKKNKMRSVPDLKSHTFTQAHMHSRTIAEKDSNITSHDASNVTYGNIL